MRVRKGMLLAALCVALTGCAQSAQPENQGIAISLSVDFTEDKQMQISCQLPNFGGAGSSENGAEQSAGYSLISATAGDFTEALTLMRATTPRNLNLAQLKSIVVSQEVAESDRFAKLVSDMLLTNRLYNAAYFIISIGSAKDMVAAQHSAMGLHLSSIVLAALENYILENRIPDTRLADVYFDLNSIYASPVAILAATSDGTHTTGLAKDRAADALPGAMPREGDNKNEYSGTALFRDGRMVGTLSSLETAFCQYLRGVTRNITYSCEGASMELSPISAPSVSVDTNVTPPVVHIDASLSVTDNSGIQHLAGYIEADLLSLIAKCQSLGVDPFLFSQRAASRFPDNDSWLRYGWLEKFPGAEIRLTVSIRRLEV